MAEGIGMDFGNRIPAWLQVVGAALTAALAIIVMLNLIVGPVQARVELNQLELSRQRAEIETLKVNMAQFRELQIRIEESTKRIERHLDIKK